MTVIISRDKNHVHLGRILAATTKKIQLLGESQRILTAFLHKLSLLDAHYTDCLEMDFSNEILEKIAKDKLTLQKLSMASAMVQQVTSSQLRESISDLNEQDKELIKAEKNYQKLIKKMENEKRNNVLSQAEKEKLTS